MAVLGLQKLNRKFRAMQAAAEKAAKESVVQGADEIAALQRSLAPKGKTGNLAASITVTPPGGRTPPYSHPGGTRTAKEAEAIVTAGNAKVRYAHLVEFGTAQHINAGKFAGSKNPGTTARPFFWPAYRALKRRVRSRITRRINKDVKTAATAGGTGP